jgi:hypothetical protein
MMEAVNKQKKAQINRHEIQKCEHVFGDYAQLFTLPPNFETTMKKKEK